ncbi:MAG: hypothetical protein JXQ67_06335 [Campylobacterales bacterium]|nr:hypothetical protein [Campylobacterales bacterium]
MKNLFAILTLFSFLNLLYAEDSINEQIEQIKNAPAKERVKLMNRLKLQISQMNKEQRAEALQKLQTRQGTMMQQKSFYQNGIYDGNKIQSQKSMNTLQNNGTRQSGH